MLNIPLESPDEFFLYVAGMGFYESRLNRDIPDKLFLRGRLPPLVKKLDEERFLPISGFVGASRLSSLKLTLADFVIPFCNSRASPIGSSASTR